MDSGTTWPEQEQIRRWLEKHGMEYEHAIHYDLAKMMTELRQSSPPPVTGELTTVELGDGSTAISDVYYRADDGPIAGVAFSKTSGAVGEIHAASTTDDLEEMFLRVLSDNPDSLAVVKAAFSRAESTLRVATTTDK